MEVTSLKRIVETNLQYAEILLVPEETDLSLIDKDAGLGNIDTGSWSRLLHYLDSLHTFQYFKIRQQFLVYPRSSPEEQPKLFIPPQNTEWDVILKKINEGQLEIIDMEVPRYPKTFAKMRSKVSSLVITSGSLDGFKAKLQHTNINQTDQKSTLEDISNIKGGKKVKK
jgi:hypothetical protein